MQSVSMFFMSASTNASCGPPNNLINKLKKCTHNKLMAIAISAPALNSLSIGALACIHAHAALLLNSWLNVLINVDIVFFLRAFNLESLLIKSMKTKILLLIWPSWRTGFHSRSAVTLKTMWIDSGNSTIQTMRKNYTGRWVFVWKNLHYQEFRVGLVFYLDLNEFSLFQNTIRRLAQF